MKDLPRKILSSLINASNEKYELHAYGSSEIAAAQKVYKAVEKWVNVVNIETGWLYGDKYMVMVF